jgi:16S rRNA (adenine1518-N6/adenine1519-N6)-dimethyltransferase
MQHRARKRFGQNFLVDESIIQRIVDSINPQAEDIIIEIGPGLGAITKPLLQRVNELNVIELDRDVIPKLMNNCKSFGKPVVHEMDVLKFDFSEFHLHSNKQKLLRIVGNLPYNISTPVLFLLLKNRKVLQDMHFMLQKEVVDRIAASPGNKIYGRLSVMVQSYFKVTPLFLVPSHAFSPAPKVESAILRLIPDEQFSINIKDHESYSSMVRQAFSQRRKTLRNTLKDFCTQEQILAVGIDPGQRAETLSVSDFLKLHQHVCQTN